MYLLHFVQNGSTHLSKCVHSNTFWSKSVLLILVNNIESGVVNEKSSYEEKKKKDKFSNPIFTNVDEWT